jgi:hypothetical protein
MKTTLFLLAAIALSLVTLPAAAQTSYDWSMVGSCGIPTDPGAGHDFTGPSYSFSAARRGTLTARYPVTNTYGAGVSKSPAWTTLWESYTDNSSSGFVQARLYKVDKCTNTQTLLCTVVSTDGSDPHCSSCTFSSSDIDFANYTYYVEVQINRSVTGPVEALHSVGIQ